MRRLVVSVLGAALVVAGTAPAVADDPIRFATFNLSLNRSAAGDLIAELEAARAGEVGSQLAAVLEIIRITDPDVLAINEIDHDDVGRAAELFAELAGYPYWYTAPSNTGIPSGFDLDNDGSTTGPGDAFGFGFFPGQFGMAVVSRFPIVTPRVRTFQTFLWADMPGALLPVDPATGDPWYTPEELAVVRLSSKSHWDVPIDVGRRAVHFLVSHPTPPVFDGPEDRNGTRNHDEIRFWADYITRSRSGYIYDDAGRRGGLGARSLFVVAGDQNADPFDGDSIPGAIDQLLDDPRVNTSVTPDSTGGPDAALRQGSNNLDHLGDPAFDTADFAEAEFGGPGNLRVDYVLPARIIGIVEAAVFWPAEGEPGFELVGPGFPAVSSDHRLVWVDLDVPGA